MNDLSPAFAAESLTVNIIDELRERLESTDSYDEEQLGLITEMEEKYNLEEGIPLSQCKYEPKTHYYGKSVPIHTSCQY
jgi:hypothetical protein